jgi:hypothetical protein
MRNAYKLLVIRPERTDHLGDIKQMYESKMDLKETGSDVDWIHLAQDSVQ